MRGAATAKRTARVRQTAGVDKSEGSGHRTKPVSEAWAQANENPAYLAFITYTISSDIRNPDRLHADTRDILWGLHLSLL